MKGECEGRELTPGAPVRVGAGVVPEHSREGASGRTEAGVKSDNQDSGTRGFQLTAVVGANQGNGTRGFTVAELTKVDNVASPLGNLQIPSVRDGAIGSYRVPSFGEDCHGRATANLGETHVQGWRENRATANPGGPHIQGWSENRGTANLGDTHHRWKENRATANLGETHFQGWSEDRATGAFKIPGFNGEGQEHSGALNLTRVSHDVTSGNLQMAGVEEEGQVGNIKALSMAQQKGEGHSSAEGTLKQDSISGSSSFISTKREAPKSAAERNFMATSKRLKQDGVGMKPLEAVIKRLKQDACAAVTATNVMDSKRVTESKFMISADVAAIRRLNEGGASGITEVTDAKRMRQDSTTETAGVTPIVNESQGSVKEAVNGACFKNLNQDTSTSTEDGKGIEKEGQDSISTKADVEKLKQETSSEFGLVETMKVDVSTKANVEKLKQGTSTEFGLVETMKVDISAKADVEKVKQGTSSEFGLAETVKVDVSPKADVEKVNQGTSAEFGRVEIAKVDVSTKADVEKLNQGTSTEFGLVETMKVQEQNSVIRSMDDSEVKECSVGNFLKSPTPLVQQEKESSNKEKLNVSPVEIISQSHPTGSPLVPYKEKEAPEALDSNAGDGGGSCIKSEKQGSPAEKPSIAVQAEEQHKDKDKEKLSVPQQESEEKKESKQENSIQEDGKGVASECVGDATEGKVPVSDPSGSSSTKPKMVSIETQCDSSGMGPIMSAEDDHTSASDDGGVPGECLGACEPGRKPHKCCQCDTSFRTPYELSRHSRVHSGERPYQCRLCHRCFKRKDHVEVHTRRHVEDRRHICGLCGVCFVTSSCLLRHQRRTHQGGGGKWIGEGEEEGEGEAGDTKGDSKDQPASKDAQRNGRRSKKNKPDTTYRPGGRTVCIIKKRNLRQRSYSFVELEDDVECFESDEEDRIPFLKVQEQRQEEEREEFGGQAGQLDHSLFPGSLFSSEASLGHLLLLGEVSRLLSHSLIPGPLEVPDSQSNVAGRPSGPEAKENDADSDDSDCGPPLVACDVTFMEGEGEVVDLSQPDDSPATPTNPEETPLKDEDKPTSQIEPCHVTRKGEQCQATHVAKETQGTINPPPPREGRMTKPSQPCAGPPSTPPISGRPAASATNNKLPGTGVGAMGVPRTAWVVPTNNAKGKNTCDACRRRNEANRLAQMAKERQTQAAQGAPKPTDNKAIETSQSCPTKVETKEPPAAPPKAPPPPKPQKLRPAASKRGRKTSSSKKRRQTKTVAVAKGAAAAPQRPHKCHLCPFNFRSATELKRHASTHSGERPFLCELCGAGFVRKCHLQLHVRRHSGERRHACQECRMRFFTPSDLARHQAIHQVGDKPLECHLCHLTFRRAFHLERHIRRHNDAAPFACKLCGAFFSSAAALRSHDKHHRTPGPHACPDCTAAFTTATALSRHRRVHSARHHRLLRAVERHATAKSSYECVSSEGSPLSLVIRKVAASSGEGGNGTTKDSTSDMPSDSAHGGKEEEEEEDEEEEEEEGRKADVSTPPASMETEEAEKSASSHSITAAEGEGRSKGSEDVTSSPSSTSKEKNDEKMTSNPSITEIMQKDNKEHTSTPPSTVKAKEESHSFNSITSTLDTENMDSEIIASASLTTKEEEESELVTSIPSITDLANDGKLMEGEDFASLPSTPSKWTGANWETSSESLRGDTTAAEEDPYDFKLTASESEVGIKSGTFSLSSKSNIKRNKKSHEEWSKFSGTNNGKEICSKSIPSFLTTDRDTEHIEELANKAINREMEHLKESENITTCSPTTEQGKVASEELKGRPQCGLPTMSEERKEAEGGGICSFLAPSRREMESVKEIHCRTTYHLTAPSGDPGSTLHTGSGFASEEDGSRSSSQDGGQTSNVREGVATSS